MHINIIGAAYSKDKPLPDGPCYTVGHHYTERYQRAYELHPYTIAKPWLDRIEQSKLWTFPDLPVASIYKISDIGLTSTISWMIAHALVEGVTELGIYGCPMMGPSHRRLAPGTAYWLGLAQGLGIKLSGNYNFIGTQKYGTQW